MAKVAKCMISRLQLLVILTQHSRRCSRRCCVQLQAAHCSFTQPSHVQRAPFLYFPSNHNNRDLARRTKHITSREKMHALTRAAHTTTRAAASVTTSHLRRTYAARAPAEVSELVPSPHIPHLSPPSSPLYSQHSCSNLHPEVAWSCAVALTTAQRSADHRPP
jgi:hypothetical protein